MTVAVRIYALGLGLLAIWGIRQARKARRERKRPLRFPATRQFVDNLQSERSKGRP